jgi:cell division protein FtsI (penicillin-binding protein 3)
MSAPQKSTRMRLQRPAARKRTATSSGEKKPKPKKKQSGDRTAIVFFMLSLILLAVAARAYILQFERTAPLKKMAEEQYLKEIAIPARRGAIYDRAGNALAVSNQVDSIYAQPHKVPSPAKAAALLAKKLGMKKEELEKKLSSDRLFVWLKRRVDPTVAAEVKALDLPFVGTHQEPRRYYPAKSLFSHLMGAVDVDGHGIEGLEATFDSELAGTPSSALGLRDARGRTLIFEGQNGSDGMQGSDIFLTVDREIQAFAEAALKDGVQEVHARAGSAIVLDPKTGDVLALANYPEFNPNNIDKVPMDVRRNHAVTDTFEPGSTFKTILMGSALEEGLVRATDQVFCENGSYRIGGHTIHDTHPLGLISAKKIVASSSNIGVAKIGVQLGRERFGDYIKAFGFGMKSGIELPGESGGIVRPARKWPLIQLATVAFGQGISVSALQLAQAYAAVANGGVMHHPRVVRMIQAPDGTAKPATRPEALRVISPETAKTLNEMLLAVVNEPGGTGARAQVPGIAVAGKTGTAQKPDNTGRGGYGDEFIANFVGYLPAEDPRAVIVVMVDEPERGKHLGGISAAPIFQKIASQTMQLMGLQPSGSIAQAPVLVDPSVGDEAELNEAESDASDTPRSRGVVPDFRGLTLREALDTLKKSELRMQPEIVGSGKVIAQDPMPGSKPKSQVLKLVLASSRAGERRAALFASTAARSCRGPCSSRCRGRKATAPSLQRSRSKPAPKPS